MADEEHDAVDADEPVPCPDERQDEQPCLLRDRRLVDERPRPEREPVRQDDVERLVGQVDAVPAAPVGDRDDDDRRGEGDCLQRRQPRERAVQPAASTREGAP